MRRYAMVLAAASVALTGCQASSAPETTPVPSSSIVETDTTETFAPGEGRPAPSDGEVPDEGTGPTETPRPTIAHAIEVRIGEQDHSDLDWHVSCTGLDGSPTVIASAADEDNTAYVVVVIGSGSDSLASFTFTETAEGQSVRERSGLTVNPGVGQGNGSLWVEDTTVTSTGRGISYDETTVHTEADMTYSVEFVCAG
ncbi:lipoprotein LpqH [Gulosibacter chungangensis]|uniref:Lipoprotein LpqH n=1 Tax=Gulosibacter chungangensis TaxID=979746 RepID=A0A7J5B958_9MICO|nr:lipoprotein LpqH [Gulosibacter chungangensis]KAB1641956.1 hypothetical protein F8O05_11605 [Gulosibacter chungangensis]